MHHYVKLTSSKSLLYLKDLWSSHLNKSKDIFLANYILSSNENYSKKLFISLYSKLIAEQDVVDKIWPERILKESEHDVIFKHYASLVYASNYEGLSLVIEDDAFWESQNNEEVAVALSWQLKNTQHNGDLAIYHDLCNYRNYINLAFHNSKQKRTRFGITRTLCSYLVNGLSANILVKKFEPYALPADFHLQCILRSEPQIAGYLSLPGLIINGSQDNIFDSSIQC